MGLRERLLRLAELELRSAARRLRGGAETLFGRPLGRPEPTWSERPHTGQTTEPRPPPTNEPPEIQRYYANLELPLGASADEVKAAYRRLMRRYHPDRHAADPERARVANQVAQQLRTAYEGLLLYLGEGDRAR